MLTGDLRNKIDAIWNDFWSGGLANPLQVIEQLTYLMFIKGLDDEQTREELKANTLGTTPRRIFPKGKNKAGEPYQNLRWSKFKNFEPRDMFRVVDEHVFPFLRELNGNGTAYAKHMRDARFQIPGPALLAKVVDKLDKLEMGDRDTKGDVYEYMLAQIASAGQNGQFRTPRHIISTMVELVRPTPEDVICDPAAGTCGFLVAAGEYLRRHHKALFRSERLRKHFNEILFNGFDFDPTMLRIGAMNMAQHGVESANIAYRDSLAEDHIDDAGRYSLVLANPPFAGSLDSEATAKDLQRIVKTKKTELLFVALFLRLLKVGGRAAVIVPDGVLFGSSKAHKDLRRILVEDNKLEAVIKLPSGVFRPYAGVSTAILVFTKVGHAGQGGTDFVWFYDVTADGWSLDDKRQPLLSDDKLGPTPAAALSAAEAAKNDLPDLVTRFAARASGERKRPRTARSFCVQKGDIVAAGYDLSLNRYREVLHEEVAHKSPGAILADLRRIEAEIAEGMTRLEGMVG
jgi:type I restriction enzyme M protein